MLKPKQPLVSARYGPLKIREHHVLRPAPVWPKKHADPGSPAEVAAALRDYLSLRLEMPEVQFDEWPTECAQGWEAYVYRFRLQARLGISPRQAQPLIMRIYSSPQGLPRVAHEFAVQRHLHGLGYSVAEPVLLEKSCRYFGGPFMLMVEMPGQTLLEATIRQPWLLYRAPRLMAEAHAWLHRLPVAGFPAPPGSALVRQLDAMADLIRAYDMQGLKPGLDWLVAHRPEPSVRVQILHLDFHPINLIYHPPAPLTVLDWPEADVGDPHADVATSLMLMECVTPESTSLRERVSVRAGRFFFRRWYLRAYRRLMPLDPALLAYYQPWAALRRLCSCGRWLHAGPRSTGSKPTVLRYLRPWHQEALRNYFRKWTGVRAGL
jgi:aminoglycoside phosphotransferase (APT) family kinase protein